MKLVLASASPRRRELLAQLGLEFSVAPADLDESTRPGEAPRDYVVRMAEEKGAAIRSLPEFRDRLVLSADTAVSLDGRIFGKPTDERHHLAMLQTFSGTRHRVLTAVCLGADDRSAVRVSETLVTFRVLTEEEIRAYWRTGEPRDKAGGYGYQGLAASFVTRVSGSRSGVVGLPLAEVRELLAEFGCRLPEPAPIERH